MQVRNLVNSANSIATLRSKGQTTCETQVAANQAEPVYDQSEPV